MTPILTFDSKDIDSEQSLDIQMYGKYIAFLRRHPIHSVRVLFEIVIPPHEGAMLSTAWQGYRDNIYICSRGTSKTFTIGSLFSPTKALLYKNTSILAASASMFRGGKTILKDSARLIKGSLKSQKPGNRWGLASLTHKPALIKKDPDMWYMEFSSNSTFNTIPTNNEESARGLRATILMIDERNNFPGEVIQKVYQPFLVVGTDFENPAEGSEGNQTFSMGTITYTHKDWYKEISSAQEIARMQFEIQRALQEGNWIIYDSLMEKYGHLVKDASISVTRYDYTDLLIPTVIGDYKVSYPGAKQGKHIKYDARDSREYIYTYPVNKKQLEEPLDQGKIDRETWEAEQRNMFIRADGNVFPFELVEQATGPIFSISEEKNRGWDHNDRGARYLPPVLHSCSDPCVLGVDNARTNDFTAFVVIRMGNMPNQFFREPRGDYDLTAHAGPSSFANVIWAEQHQQMTIKQVASKIYEFRQRYNIVATRTAPGIISDARGGGVNLRDELVSPSPDIDPTTGLALANWVRPQRIFDPDDKDDRMGKDLLGDVSSWFGLRLLWTNDVMNQEMVGFAKAQLQASKLFIGNSHSRNTTRDPGNIHYPGWVGVDILKHQLLRIQGVTTPSGKNIQYVMPGDQNKIENKKDLLFAFLYACYGLRDWVTQQLRVQQHIPVAYGEVIRIGGRR